MYSKTFVRLYRRTISSICTIFKMVHATSDMNNIHKFQDIWRILARVKACTDRLTGSMNKKDVKKIHLVGIKKVFKLVFTYYTRQNFMLFCDRISWNVPRFNIYNLTRDLIARFEFLQLSYGKVCQIQFHCDFFPATLIHLLEYLTQDTDWKAGAKIFSFQEIYSLAIVFSLMLKIYRLLPILQFFGDREWYLF